MARGIHGAPTGIGWWQRSVPLLLGALLLVSFPSDGRCGRFVRGGGKPAAPAPPIRPWHSGSDDWRGRTLRLSSGKDRQPPPPENWGQDRRLSPEDSARLRNRYRQWQSLPPERQQDLRRRMERWKELPPADRELLRRRYQQWQQLSPEERQRMRDGLNRWNQLPPDEQERFRQRFRRP